MALTKPVAVPGAHVAAVTSALLIAQQVAGKAARDALFLSSFRSSYFPVVMAIAAVLSLGAVYWLSRLMVVRAPATILSTLLAVSALGYVLEWALSFRVPTGAALLVYFHTALFGPVLLSAFWSLINERFDPHTAKHAVARITGGGTLGGVLGGLVVWRASTVVQPAMVLLLLATLNALALVGALLTRARGQLVEQATKEVQTADISPLRAFKEAPFLRDLALLVALGTATSAILDYVFSAQAVAVFGRGQALLSFFSLFWLGVAILSFLLQLSLGGVALEKLGMALSIAIQPALVVLGGALALAVPGLASASALRGVEAIQRNTLFRSAYEVLYTPLLPERRRATKLLIDVGFDRVGTVVGSAISLVAVWAFYRNSAALLFGSVIILATATLLLTRRLHVGYVESLQEGLREGATKLDPSSDEGFARLSTGPGRDQLIERIEELQPGGLSVLLGTRDAPKEIAPTTLAVNALANPDTLLSTARELLSADLDRARNGLARLEARGLEVACAIRLLAHRELHDEARRALSGIAVSVPGQLLDALLDPTTDFAVRRRIPRVLRHCPTPRVLEGLLLGIADPRFEVRYECGGALLAVTAGSTETVISEQKALEVIRREVETRTQLVENVSAGLEFDDEANSEELQSSLVDGLLRDRVDRILEHVFTILCLHLDRDPIRMAFRALHHEDARHRGTALEYLHVTLPVEVRELVWPFLGGPIPLPSPRRADELLAEMTLAAG